MLMAIDIGNTNINIGIFKGNRIIRRYSLPTQNNRSNNRIIKIFKNSKIDNVVLCSVVPKMTRCIEKTFKKTLKKAPLVVGKDFVVPIRNLYRKPKEVGQDRLVNAYAGILRYKPPIIVVDFGTAVTFDIISKRGAYLGGMILPGLELSLEALYQKTALLPRIKLTNPKELIGRDTRSSMLSGVVYGLAALTDDLILRIRKKIGQNTKAIGTGGSISLIKNYCKEIDYTDKDLTLKGLNAIYNKKEGAC